MKDLAKKKLGQLSRQLESAQAKFRSDVEALAETRNFALLQAARLWCQVTIWSNETRINVCGGSVWPAAWPQLFQVVGPQHRQSTLMTPMAVERFAAAGGACS